MKNTVFVYGTLRKGGAFNKVLPDEAFKGVGYTKPVYDLVSLGQFPAALPGGGSHIEVEIYEVDREELFQMDRIEGHPDFYTRTSVNLEDGTPGFMYVLHGRDPEGGAGKVLRWNVKMRCVEWIGENSGEGIELSAPGPHIWGEPEDHRR